MEGETTDSPIVIGDVAPARFMIDLPPMDLPSGAVLNDDGTVTLNLEYPATIKLRAVGSDAVAREETITQLVFRRLGGAEVRKMVAAKNASVLAMALSSGLGLGRFNMLQQVMLATDEGAAGDVVSELLGSVKLGLPERAVETPEAITLPLFAPAAGEDGVVYQELTFKRITAAQKRQASEAPNYLDWGVVLATGQTPKIAKTLVDAMDGADAMGVHQVILFLCGSGRRTGR